MKHKQFELLAEHILQEAKETRTGKGRDYTRDSDDALANFKRCGERIGVTPQKALLIYMSKHSDAIETYIKTGGQSESEPIKTRIIDNINYLLLLWGLIEEENERTLS